MTYEQRMDGLRAALLDAMSAITSDTTEEEFLRVRSRWRHFVKRATEQAEKPGQARTIVEEIYGTSQWAQFQAYRDRRWHKSPTYRAWRAKYDTQRKAAKKAYDSARYQARKQERCPLCNAAPDEIHRCSP